LSVGFRLSGMQEVILVLLLVLLIVVALEKPLKK